MNRERAFGERLWRAAVITAGILGGFAAIDAIFLFLFLVGAAFFVDAPNPYIGLVMLVILPVITVLGGGTAWAAYSVLKRRTPRPQAEHQAVA
jgi:drug/metabolite transporter (DMT)-like permease